MPFKLLGFDTLDVEWYYLDGEYAMISDAYAAAYARFDELEREQPSRGSGGQDGIQDQVWLVPPIGPRQRLYPAHLREWAKERVLEVLKDGPLTEAEIAERL